MLFSFMVALAIVPSQEVHAATEMVNLVPANVPIEIKAGDTLYFTRTAAVYNNIVYTEYFRNDPAEASIWGFSTTGTGHSVRYNGTSVRLEGGTWDNHSFIAAFEDAWVRWSFEGNIGTLEFLQDWPTPIVGLYSSVAMTTSKTAWSNETNISVFATLEQTIVYQSDGTLPSDYGFEISVLGSPVLVDDLFEIVEIEGKLQLKSVAGADVIENGINYVDIYSILTSGTNPISISFGDGIRLFNSTIYERFSGALGTEVRFGYNFEAMNPTLSITDLGTSLREVKIYNGETLLETYTGLSYAMGGTWIAVVIEDIYERTEVTFMNELVEFATESVIEGFLVANPGIPVKTGYTFIGWETETGHIWDFNNDVATGVTLELTAKYIADEAAVNTISFVTNGGTAVSSLTVADNTFATIPTAPTRAGYIFAGWYSNATLTTSFSFTAAAITENITLYAKWAPVTIVTFYNDTINYATVTVIEGSLVSSPEIPVKAGFIFTGWETVSDHIWDFNNDVVVGDVLYLYASYVAEGTVLNTISFVTNGGTAVSDLLVEDDTIATAPTTPTRTGYTFTGWYSNVTLSTVFSFIETAITDDITLYAKWTPVSSGGTIIPPAEAGLTTLQISLIVGGVLLVAAALFIPDKKKSGSRR